MSTLVDSIPSRRWYKTHSPDLSERRTRVVRKVNWLSVFRHSSINPERAIINGCERRHFCVTDHFPSEKAMVSGFASQFRLELYIWLEWHFEGMTKRNNWLDHWEWWLPCLSDQLSDLQYLRRLWKSQLRSKITKRDFRSLVTFGFFSEARSYFIIFPFVPTMGIIQQSATVATICTTVRTENGNWSRLSATSLIEQLRVEPSLFAAVVIITDASNMEDRYQS
jgi:hypothetical protein